MEDSFYIQSTPSTYIEIEYYLFDITEFRYKGSYINGLKVLGENIQSAYIHKRLFVISEFDIEGVDCID